MHDPRPSDSEGEYLPPAGATPTPPQYSGYRTTEPKRSGWRTAGGVGAVLLAGLAKFKAVLFLLLNFKWLIFLPKIALSFGTLFVSIWFYALLFGWKFGIVFVLLILVHELGHYVTFRNFGIKADLPFFIPGLGAFVAARGPAPSLTTEAIATLAGPVFGIAASGLCYAYAIATHEPFWFAAAYVGFFLNALNLLPIPPFDGGGIAAAIDPRLWILGAFGFVAFLVYFGMWSPFTIVIVALVAFTAIPRIIAMWKGAVDPRFAGVSQGARLAIAAAYFVTFALAAAGAAVSYFDPRHIGVT
jgi:Zn-dependent protease